MTAGSKYVVAAFAAILIYLGYQIWFNPTRKVQRRLGELAAALSIPDHEGDLGRVARLAQLRGFFTVDVRVRAGGGELSSRDTIVGVISAYTAPAGGADVQFVDLTVKIDKDRGDVAQARGTVEVTTRDARSGQPVVESREASAMLQLLNGEWMITSAEVTPLPDPRP
jgi:hypothetical protein